MARRGGGKRGGYRVLVASNQRERWIVMLGFAKSERDNLDDDELDDLKLLARCYLALSEEALLRGLASGELVEIDDGKPEGAQVDPRDGTRAL